jgi:hypothetical protein
MAEQRFATRDEVVAILAPEYVHVDAANAVLDALAKHGADIGALLPVGAAQQADPDSRR